MSNDRSKTKTINPSWKFYSWAYLAGVLLAPLVIGIVILWRTRNRQLQYKYVISDQTITAEDGTYSQKFDLVNLESVDLNQSWIHRKLDVGELILHKEGASMNLKGIESPKDLQNMLLTVSANLKAMQEQQQKEIQQPEKATTTGMDRINYLTGLWQQGLLSDEDYHKEKKHFE